MNEDQLRAEFTFAQDGMRFPFVEDESCNITGYGLQNKADFAAAVNFWDELAGMDVLPDERWTADDVTYRWLRSDRDGGDTFQICASSAAGAFPVTTLWGKR